MAILFAFLSTLLAGALMLWLMPACIRKLRQLKFGQTMYSLGPQSHLSKQGTPNMGGIAIGGATMVSLIVFVLAYCAMKGTWTRFLTLKNALWGLLFVSFGAMLIGFADDYIKDVKKNHEGLRPMQKIAGQLIVGLLFSVWAYTQLGSEIILPFTRKTWDLGVFYIPLITLTVLFMTNSANLQDGLDGLLSSVAAVGMAAFGGIALLMAAKPSLWLLPLSGETTGILCFALAGACLGFLRFNHYPAQIFMGDTGSMLIGGVMVGAAVVLRCEFLLLTLCFTCVMSSASVILQRYYYKLTHGKRIFKMSPIHHHFELCGMKETQIVRMYTLVTLLGALIAFASVWQWIF